MTNYHNQKYGIEDRTSTNPTATKNFNGTFEVTVVENPLPINFTQITTMQILLFCSLLCSSDVVSAVSIVDYSQQPKLYSCIFGEGVFNDIVSIILFYTVLSL